ncbi:MAG: KaiC domain-containing protein [Synergistetes bacterium]|nr:KaiC domain-containing protein [Synergistota bacterium]
MKEAKVVERALSLASDLKNKAPKLFGIASGVEGLDELFYSVELKNGKIVRKPLGGYPYRAVINLTGMPDTGKSLMAEQFAVKQASLGYPVCFVTVESPAPFLMQGLKIRSNAMGIKWEEVENKIAIIDAATYSILREDLPSLLKTIEKAIEEYEIKSVIVDSITGLYEAKEIMARSIVRKVFNFLKRFGQTGLLISQKRSSHEAESAEAAGGYAVSHICDVSMVTAKKVIQTQRDEKIFKKTPGTLVRTFRIDGSRMCGHDTDTHLLEITETGLAKIGPKIAEIE